MLDNRNRINRNINCHLHETSVFFVFLTYVEIILMRCVHSPVVANSAKIHGMDFRRGFLKEVPQLMWADIRKSFINFDTQVLHLSDSHVSHV